MQCNAMQLSRQSDVIASVPHSIFDLQYLITHNPYLIASHSIPSLTSFLRTSHSPTLQSFQFLGNIKYVS